MQRGFSAILLLVGVLAVVALAYYFGRTTVPSSQIQTPQGTEASRIASPTATPFPLQTRQSVSPTPISKPTTSADLKSYSDTTYNYTIQYSNAWILKQDKDGGGYARVKLTDANSAKTAFSMRSLPELYLTIISPYSTSSGVCFNQSCDEDGKLSVTIKGKKYGISVTKGSVNSQFDFYAFQFDIPDKKLTMQGFSEPVQLSAYASFKTMEEGQVIADILSTLSY